MVKRYLRVLICLCAIVPYMIGCQMANPSSVGMDATPSTQQTQPTTALPTSRPTTIPTMPTTIPTIPTTTLPTQPPVKKEVTPVNTYVKGYYDDELRVNLEIDRAPDESVLSSLEKGKVTLSPGILAAIETYDPRTVFYVKVDFSMTFDWKLSWDAHKTDERYIAMRADLVSRFREAGYVIDDSMGTIITKTYFWLFASAEQLEQLNCGDDMTVYIYAPPISA